MGQYYLIKERLEPCKSELIHGRGRKSKYVANVSWDEFEQNAELFDMGIDIELQKGRVPVTMIDVSQELEENENHFFDTKNLRFFRLFTERAERLLNIVNSLKDHSMQVRDLYHYQMEVNRNNHMEMLTILSAIFMPLTLITSWFGMNFVHMPELEKPWAYPVVIGVCVTIVLVNIIILKKKKWI